MKCFLVNILVLIATVTPGYTYPMDYYQTPVCAYLQGQYKTFPDIQALMKEIRITGECKYLQVSYITQIKIFTLFPQIGV